MLKAMLEGTRELDRCVFVTDRSTRVLVWSKGCESCLGIPADAAIGRHCFDLLQGRDPFGNRFCMPGCAIVRMRDDGEPVRPFEMLVTTPEGRRAMRVLVHHILGPGADLPLLVYELAPREQVAPEAVATCPEGQPGQPIPGCPRAIAAAERSPPAATTLPDAPAARPDAPKAGAPRPAPAAERGHDDSGLTPREMEILGLLAQGLGTEDIASELCISRVTVRNHVQNILAKLGVHSRIEAVALALRRGWIVPT